MTRAAAELNVTVGAVSREIEDWRITCDGPLLHRGRRGVELTAQGDELYAVLSAGFSRISQTLDHLKTAHTPTTVTIGASTAITSLWLMKRIGTFWRLHPDIMVNHLISDNAAIFGDPKWNSDSRRIWLMAGREGRIPIP